MKRLISCVLILVLLMAAIPASAAGKTAKLVLDAPYGVGGGELEVEVRVENLDSCGIFGLVLEYDSTVLKPLDFSQTIKEGATISEEMERGVYSVAWMIENLDKPLKGTVVFGTLKFQVLKSVASTALKVGKVEIASTSEDDLQPVTFENPTVPIYKKNHSFTDVTAKWYQEAVLFAYNNNLMQGMGGNKFEPDSATTRAMLATILYRQEGEPHVVAASPFTDLKQAWYRNPINWAFEMDIVRGTGATTFEPENKVTREQIAVMLYRYAEYKGMNTSLRKSISSFSDHKLVSSWAKDAMEWAYAAGFITGNSINGKVVLDPQGDATRAQIATILMRYIKSATEQ